MTPLPILKTVVSLATLTAALWAGSAQAILIEYDLVNLGSNKYRYDYTVTNDGTLFGEAPVEAFLISFDNSLYLESSLQHVTANPLDTLWYEEILGSVSAITSSDFSADSSENLLNAIANGASLGKFMVEFKWLGLGTPGSQPFEIYDLDNSDPVNQQWQLVESGQTQLRNAGPEQVPEPSVLVLLGMGFLVISLVRRRKWLGFSPLASHTF